MKRLFYTLLTLSVFLWIAKLVFGLALLSVIYPPPAFVPVGYSYEKPINKERCHALCGK